MLSKSGAHAAPRRGRSVLRGLALLAVVLVWLGISGVGGMRIGQLSDVQENDDSAFLPASAESTRAGELAAEFSDDEVLPALVVVEATDDRALTDDDLARAQEFADGVGGLELAEGRALEDLLVGPAFAAPSDDGEAALVTVLLDADAANEQIGEERGVNLAVESLREAADEELAGDGLDVWVTGPAGFVADLVGAFAGIDGILLLVALSVVFVILVIVYRSPSLPFAVLFTALFGLAGAALVVHALASADVLVLNGQSQGILFILVVGAATDYSLLLVARYREELTRSDSVVTAMRRAVRGSVEPITASAGTVIAGLLCLLLSDLASNSSLGPVAAVGIVAAYLAAMTLLPALLLLGGERFARYVFWPRVPRPGASAAADETAEEVEERSGLWGRISRGVAAHPRRTWVVTAVALVAACAFVPQLRASGTGDDEVFLTQVESVAGQEVLVDHFDAGRAQPVQVVAPEADLDAVLEALTGVDGVADAAPVTEDAGGPPPGVEAGLEAGGEGEGPPPGVEAGGEGEPAQDAPPLVVDGRVLVEAVTEAPSDSQEAVDVVRDIRTAVHEVADEALVGGAAAESLDTRETSARDLRLIVPTVLGVILLVLIGLLRAVVAPLLLMVANLLSFGAALGIGALVFNEVLDFPGADPAVPLYAFVFLVALGIDYSIFLMTRVREEAVVHGTRDGVRRGLAVTGGVITSAGIVLAATFGALVVIPLLFLAQLAFLVAFGVLVDALVVRTLLVPGLVHDVGRAAWWPWHGRIAA